MSIELRNTTIAALSGTWELDGYGAIDNEQPTTTAPESDTVAWSNEVVQITDAWLEGHPRTLPEIADAAGLTLVISDDGSFTETGDADSAVAVWSSDGTLGDAGDVYDGRLAEVDGRVFAFSSDSDGEPGDYQRFSGDNADITEEFFAGEDGLVRVVSVVFDGMYLYRHVYTYRSA